MSDSQLLVSKANEAMAATEAVIQIYRHQLDVLKRCEHLIVTGSDDEALHDFRVAVRRTRCGLSQFKKLFPTSETEPFRHYFAWLGAITTPARDLEVYLGNFPDYQNSLPATQHSELLPLHHQLHEQLQQAQNQLLRQLKSSEYQQGLNAWEHWLQTHTHTATTLTAKELANYCIEKNYRLIIKQGQDFDKETADENWHDLRKRCKKLRYLLEFFQNLYQKTAITIFIKQLKHLQEILGQYQDLSVQIQAIKNWQQQTDRIETQLVLKQLQSHLTNNQRQLQKVFLKNFATFSHSKQQKHFKKLITTS